MQNIINTLDLTDPAVVLNAYRFGTLASHTDNEPVDVEQTRRAVAWNRALDAAVGERAAFNAIGLAPAHDNRNYVDHEVVERLWTVVNARQDVRLRA